MDDSSNSGLPHVHMLDTSSEVLKPTPTCWTPLDMRSIVFMPISEEYEVNTMSGLRWPYVTARLYSKAPTAINHVASSKQAHSHLVLPDQFFH
ncbi:hypothetical protein AAF712_004031 [Marasmius tenuissimus]|uniref:Uncharacterized protein n=1 Tax=Marasmius tenuissimus TaxID=585030 RepID=A0ABR3A4X9_9AGAR